MQKLGVQNQIQNEFHWSAKMYQRHRSVAKPTSIEQVNLAKEFEMYVRCGQKRARAHCNVKRKEIKYNWWLF